MPPTVHPDEYWLRNIAIALNAGGEGLPAAGAGVGGGGSNTQYAEGATVSVVTGTLMEWKDQDGPNLVRPASRTYPFPTQTIDLPSTIGTITARDTASTTTTGQGNSNIITGTPTANSFLQATFTGNTSFAIQVSGSWAGTLAFERSLDGGTTWTDIAAFAAGTAYTFKTITQNGAFHGNASSCTNIRVRSTGASWTGTANIRILTGEGTGTITVGNVLRIVDRSLLDKQFTVITSSTTETTIVTADPNFKNDIYQLIITNTSATATEVVIRETTAGSPVDSFWLAAGDTKGFTVPAGSATKQTSAGTNWTAQCSASVASIKISARIYKSL